MDYSKYDFKDSTEDYVYLSKKGLSKHNHFMGGEQY
jgi:Fe-S cluster assembly protein SufB